MGQPNCVGKGGLVGSQLSAQIPQQIAGCGPQCASASQPVKVPVRCRSAAKRVSFGLRLSLGGSGRQTEGVQHNVLNHLVVGRFPVYLGQRQAEHGRAEV
jgi:hypothetical protein